MSTATLEAPAQQRELLTREEAATLLGVSANTLAVWQSTGRYSLPMVRVGRLARYRRSDLLAWIDRRTQRQL